MWVGGTHKQIADLLASDLQIRFHYLLRLILTNAANQGDTYFSSNIIQILHGSIQSLSDSTVCIYKVLSYVGIERSESSPSALPSVMLKILKIANKFD